MNDGHSTGFWICLRWADSLGTDLLFEGYPMTSLDHRAT